MEVDINEKPTSRLIFRPEVVRRYIQEREQVVMPKHLAPSIFIFLWALLGTLIVVLIYSFWIKIPIFTSATAIVQNYSSDSSTSEPLLLVFFPAAYCSTLHHGQLVYYKLSNSTELDKTIIVKIDSTILNPRKAESLLQRYNQTGIRINEPVLIASALFAQPVGSMAKNFDGSILNVEIIVGYQRLISFLPVLSELFKNLE
jgi:hypothetical protein